MADDDTRTLRRGERNRVWAKPGPDDPAGPYDMRFVGYSTTTEWGSAVEATHPAGGPGVYRWVANDVPGGPDGTQQLTSGSYQVQVRYADGDLVDIEQLPDNLQVE